MNTFARRGLQASAIVAGLAVVGTNLAGSAFAELPTSEERTTEVRETSAAPTGSPALELVDPSGSATNTSSLEKALPPVFVFEPPRLNTNDPDNTDPVQRIVGAVTNAPKVLDLEAGVGPLGENNPVNIEVDRVNGPDLTSLLGGDNNLGVTPSPETARTVVDILGQVVTERQIAGQKLG